MKRISLFIFAVVILIFSSAMPVVAAEENTTTIIGKEIGREDGKIEYGLFLSGAPIACLEFTLTAENATINQMANVAFDGWVNEGSKSIFYAFSDIGGEAPLMFAKFSLSDNLEKTVNIRVTGCSAMNFEEEELKIQTRLNPIEIKVVSSELQPETPEETTSNESSANSTGTVSEPSSVVENQASEKKESSVNTQNNRPSDSKSPTASSAEKISVVVFFMLSLGIGLASVLISSKYLYNKGESK